MSQKRLWNWTERSEKKSCLTATGYVIHLLLHNTLNIAIFLLLRLNKPWKYFLFSSSSTIHLNQDFCAISTASSWTNFSRKLNIVVVGLSMAKIETSKFLSVGLVTVLACHERFPIPPILSPLSLSLKSKLQN